MEQDNWLSVLNPRKKYPRRYPPGYFLKLSRRYHRSKERSQQRPAKILFATVFGSRTLQKLHKSIFGHALVPIVLSFAIAVLGHNVMLIRSMGLMVCALWLTIDIGIWISGKSWQFQWKSILFSLLFTLILSVSMWTMKRFLSSTLEDQRNDAYRNLQFEHNPIGETDEPMQTTFSVRNNSGQVISKKHRMTCFIRHFISNDEVPIIFEHLTPYAIKGNLYLATQEDPKPSHVPSDEVLEAGGDADTEDCLGFLRYKGLLEHNAWTSG